MWTAATQTVVIIWSAPSHSDQAWCKHRVRLPSSCRSLVLWQLRTPVCPSRAIAPFWGVELEPVLWKDVGMTSRRLTGPISSTPLSLSQEHNSQFTQSAGSSRQSCMNTGKSVKHTHKTMWHGIGTLNAVVHPHSHSLLLENAGLRCCRNVTVTSLQSSHLNPAELLWDQVEQDVRSMNALPKNLQQLCHTTEPKWTKIPVEQLTEFMSPRFHMHRESVYVYTQYVSLFVLLSTKPTQTCLTETKRSINNRYKEERQRWKNKKQTHSASACFSLAQWTALSA